VCIGGGISPGASVIKAPDVEGHGDYTSQVAISSKLPEKCHSHLERLVEPPVPRMSISES
jgi:hypothetical protein